MSFPTVNFLDPSFRRSPHTVLTNIRNSGGLAKINNFDAYLIADYTRCASLLKDNRIGLEQTNLEDFDDHHPLVGYFQMRRKLMLFQNPPAHTHLRELAEPSMSAKNIRAWETTIRKIAQTHIARLDTNQPVDFVREISQPFVSEVICTLVGFPSDDADFLAKTTQTVADGLDPLGPLHSKVNAGDAYRKFDQYIRSRLCNNEVDEECFSQLASTFLGQAAQCPHQFGASTSEEDIAATVVMLLAAGHQTTNHSLSLSVMSLLQEFPEYLTSTQVISPLLVEEFFRYHCPAQITRRTVREDITLNGQHIRQGTALWLALVSANRDETVFPDAQTIDLNRRPNQHLSFGAGIHFCIGATLARLQLRVFLEELSGRFPSLHITKDGITHDPNLIFRGLKHLRLSL